MIEHRHRLLPRCLALVSGLILAGLAGPLPAFPMSLVEVPAVTEITDGTALAFALRFNQPVNRYLSTLTLVRADRMSMLGVRLSAHAHATNGEILAGMIPFTVTR